jgi:CRISPR-associated endonuclease/helicase Cas3
MNYNLISHSKESNGPLKLWDHLNQVVTATEHILGSKSLSFSGLSKQQIIDICRIAAACHDFGKSTSFFQDYINSKFKNGDYEGGQQEKSHALISAFFGYYFAEKWLINNQPESHWNTFIPFAVFMAIEGHHTMYKSIEEIIKSSNDNFDLMKKQLASINPEIFKYRFNNIDLSTSKDFNIEQIDNISCKLRKFGRDYRKVPKGYDKDKWLDMQIEHRILALLLYSALLEADKAYLASDNPNQYERKPIHISGDLVDKYINKISDSKLINIERSKAYKDVIQSINEMPLEQRIHSVTLPTGLGKTLLSASWALKLRNRIENEWGFSPKIIVSLPFLSIIEQTDEE